MNTSVIYFSKTGHSKKLAEAIGKELEIPVTNINTNGKIKEADLLFVVGGIYAGKSAPEMIKYISSLDNSQVKRVALITSCTSKTTKQDMIREILEKKGIDVLSDEFVCQGSFLFFGLGHPSTADIEKAVSFAKEQLFL